MASEVFSTEPFLAARNLGRRYGPITALEDVSVQFLPGEVHAIVGENGAGKSTLMRLLSGEDHPDSGEIFVEGRAVNLDTPAKARAHGIAIVHQHFQLVEQLTVAENMCLEVPPIRWKLGPLSIVDKSRMRKEAARRLADFHLDHKIDHLVRELTVAEKQLIEISRAIDGSARLLILDEPTASLGAAEAKELFRHVAAMRAKKAAIILIAHNIDEVMEVSDRITVLRNGRLIASGLRSAFSYDDIVRMIAGREMSHDYPKAEIRPGEAMLRFGQITKAEDNSERTIEVKKSEIVGIPAYVGASTDDLLNDLMDPDHQQRLNLWLGEEDFSRANLRRRVSSGMCLIPGDAMAEGLVPNFSIEDNILLPNFSRFSRMGVVQRDRLRESVKALMDDLDIRPRDASAKVSNLSGGNRQKVVIAKWLASGARVYLMNDPTKAVDVGAKWEIYRLIVDLAKNGCAVLLVSSDLDELVGLADQVLVFRGGMLLREFPGRPVAKGDLMDAVVGSRGM